MPIFLDTHAWVWWVTADRRLSKRALSEIQTAIPLEGVWISAISIWEIAKKVQKKRLVLDRPLRQWLAQATGMRGLYIAELTNEILIAGCELPSPFHGDPADQMIVATVRHHDGRLITKDERLQNYTHIHSIW